MKYVLIILFSIIVSINSAIYIYCTANKLFTAAVIIELIQPFILLFTLNEYLIATTLKERIYIAASQGIGYAIGTGLTIYYI